MKKNTRTGRRYYSVGEEVWLKTLGKKGKVLELDIKPKQNIYKVKVETVVGKNNALVETWLDVWDIDKCKQNLYREKRKNNRQNQPEILFAKVRPTAKIPSKNEEDAGYDIYADFEEEAITIPPHTVKLIPTGIAMAVSVEWCLYAVERGSTGSKNMAKRAGLIDSGFRDEAFIALGNNNDIPLIIAKNPSDYEKHYEAIVYPYNKAIAQLVLLPVYDAKIKEISYDELKEIPSKRGTGKLGSSGK